MSSNAQYKGSLHSQNIIACIWDFDKTLISGYMQEPIFKKYNIDGEVFWKEVNQLPEIYAKRGISVSKDTVYLNHLLNYVKNGALKGLNNAILHKLGEELVFYSGLPEFFDTLKQAAQSKDAYKTHGISLEHYIISTGLAAMIKGSLIAPFVEGIYGCEFVENPLPPGFSKQQDLIDYDQAEISQIGVMVDNTIKTRFIFEINKGSNRDSSIDVNAKMASEDRRIPFNNMIYIADGPSDVPVFSVVKKQGGKTYAVYDPSNKEEFAQNDNLLQSHRIHAYGPANYAQESPTAMWLQMHVERICDRIVKDRQSILEARLTQPPKHLPKTQLHPSLKPLCEEQIELL